MKARHRHQFRKLFLLLGAEASLATCDINWTRCFDGVIVLLNIHTHISKQIPLLPAGGVCLWEKKHPVPYIYVFTWAFTDKCVKLEAKKKSSNSCYLVVSTFDRNQNFIWMIPSGRRDASEDEGKEMNSSLTLVLTILSSSMWFQPNLMLVFHSNSLGGSQRNSPPFFFFFLNLFYFYPGCAWEEMAWSTLLSPSNLKSLCVCVGGGARSWPRGTSICLSGVPFSGRCERCRSLFVVFLPTHFSNYFPSLLGPSRLLTQLSSLRYIFYTYVTWLSCISIISVLFLWLDCPIPWPEEPCLPFPL